MKTNRPWLIVIVILIVVIVCLIFTAAGLMLYLVSRPTTSTTTTVSTTPPTAVSPAPAPAAAEWTIESQVIKKSTPTASVNLSYPQIKGFPDAAVMANFNTQVQKDMQAISDEVTALPATGMSTANSANLDYTVAYKSDNLVSIASQGGEYTGGAHPNALIYTLNYDLVKGKKLSLGDLFTDNTYLKTISDYCIAELNARGLGDTGMVESGAAASAGNYIYFDITDAGTKGIEIIFPPYQVAPYAAGTQIVSIPVSKFSSLLKPEYAAVFK